MGDLEANSGRPQSSKADTELDAILEQIATNSGFYEDADFTRIHPEAKAAIAALIESEVRRALERHRRQVVALKGSKSDLTADMNRALDWVLEDIDAELEAGSGEAA